MLNLPDQLLDEATIAALPREDRIQAIRLLTEAERRRSMRKIDTYYPETGPLSRHAYSKYMKFFEAGAKYGQRCALAANRVGKTEGLGGYEVTCHLTGEYPPWWKGRRFDRPTTFWASGTTNLKTKEIVQQKLLGRIGQQGTGLIPGALILRTTPKAGIPDAILTVEVRHKSGGVSTLTFKSNEQGRQSFEGNEVDGVWLDEEHDADVYHEAKTRTMSTTPGEPSGIIILTFTPMEGLTETALLFAPSGRPIDGVDESTGRFTINLTWDDAPHLTPEIKAEEEKSMPPYMRDARMRGIPQLGSGAIFPVSETEITTKDFPIPAHWQKAFALDVGWNNTAALWIAKNPQTKVCYLYSVHKQQHEQPSVHAQAIKARGPWIPGTIDPAARGRSQHDGKQLIDSYKQLGLKLTVADNAVESGIMKVWSALVEGRLKVFASCEIWFQEFRVYRRDKHGKIVKSNDHLMDCTRYWFTTGEEIATTEPDEAQTAFKGVPVTGQSGVFGRTNYGRR